MEEAKSAIGEKAANTHFSQAKMVTFGYFCGLGNALVSVYL